MTGVSLAMALEERYGVKIVDDPEENQKIFASVRSLAEFVPAPTVDGVFERERTRVEVAG